MNKILHLFDEKYVKDFLSEKVLPKYPDFVSIKKVTIKPWKKHVWESTYHVVLEFKTVFKTKDGKIKKLPIFCSAHSNEPRENVYHSLEFLWKHGFGKGYLTIPHPLFYSDYFQATFYRGIDGNHLYYYIRENNFPVIEAIVEKAAKWFNKLHNLEVEEMRNFNEENSRIRTVFPGADHTCERIKHDYPEHYDFYKKAYSIFMEKEEKFLSTTEKRWLVHGDAHPENIIKMGHKKIGLIDFTDLCLSDFTRDIGTFLQQLEFMCNRKISDRDYSKKIKQIFLDSYFSGSSIKLNQDIQDRINNYYNWTSLRTATFFLLKYDSEPERALPLIEKIKNNLQIN